MKHTLIMTCGLPGSGKTTFLQKNADEICAIYGIQHRLSSDDVIAETAMHLNSTYTNVFQDSIQLAHAFVDNMVGILSLQRQSFIIDRTALTKKSRMRTLALLKNAQDYDKIALVFNDVSAVELRRRLDKRNIEEGKLITPALITQMAASYEYPSIEEGFNAIMSVEDFHKTLPQVNQQAFGEATFN